jgi:heme-degrading monooxygenase HmoA
MSIIRLIFVKIDPSDLPKARRVWKDDCAPLMIQQEGCLSEKLLACKDAPGELISYSDWESEAAVNAYRNSEAHKEIVRHSRSIAGAKVEVKLYELSD